MESIHAKNSEIIQLQSKLEEKAIYYLIKSESSPHPGTVKNLVS